MEINVVIKAPNQKVSDQNVTCGVDWTVRNLKEHIANQYPTKPPIEEQRLIFAGRYLNDEANLVDALKQNQGANIEEEEHVIQVHTVHLVCTQDAPSRTKSAPLISSPKNGDRTSIVGEDGLRRRINSSGQPLTNQDSARSILGGRSNNGQNASQQHANHSQACQPPFSPMMESQEAYYAAWGAYMEMYRPWYDYYYHQHQNYYGVPDATQPTEDQPEQQPQPAEPARAPPEEPRMAPPNNQMRMDAQGNAFLADDDDDDENGRREWDFLDWMYTIARMGVFLSIIYFYSNVFRFGVVVMCAFLLQYLHQALRHPNNRGRVEQPPPQAPPRQPEGVQEEAAADVVRGEENEPQNPIVNENNVPAPPVTVAQQEEETPRGVSAVWGFVYTFFSSLFPEVPAPN